MKAKEGDRRCKEKAEEGERRYKENERRQKKERGDISRTRES